MRAKLKKYTFPAVSLLLVLMFYQNCSDVRLSKSLVQEKPPVVVNSSFSTSLPVPEPELARTRFIILVDQSFSMAWGKCPSDLDGANPKPSSDIFSCSRADGVDPDGNRFVIIEKWIQQLLDASTESSDIKLLIVPISGGLAAKRPNSARVHPDGSTDADHMEFLDLDEASDWLQILKQEHFTTRTNQASNLMGTTVFEPSLQYARAKIIEELTELKDINQVSGTNIELVLMSDGAFKPNQTLLDSLKINAGCPDCSRQPNHISCTCFSSNCWTGSTPPGQYCSNLQTDFFTHFGNPSSNDPVNIQAALDSLLNLQNQSEYSGIKFKMRAAKINWDEVPVEDKNTENDIERNIFDQSITSLEQNISIKNFNSEEPPFSLIASQNGSRSFTIKNIYMVQRNAFVNKKNQLVADSDGDGIGDLEEVSLGTEPLKPRSNAICLDSIQQRFGCQSLGCEANVDKDRDGLNECEEITIGTSDEKIDSDNDNIPDYFEVIRGLNPALDDRENYRLGSSFSDHDKFRRGVHPAVRMEDVSEFNTVDLKIQFQGFMTNSTEGNVNAVGSYVIDIVNLPLVTNRPVANSSIVAMKDSIIGDLIPNPKRLDSIAQSANQNEIFFLLQISSMETPGQYSWHILRDYISIETRDVSGLNQRFDLRNFIQIKGEVL
ncbi:MAG: thrombospondin type 3 repeat-containing protein [Bdellovibrionales bacterium]